ncbi:ABC transporter permease [Aidingimonas lacisalsi]|uniref:ABC transporter permease n=1 Tax=Aidingimonas lacisalsi TaxID=2604086 RepID=UPI001F41C114|nr:ABC transporter permease [Aidingimonas lacisalsi]
MIRSPSNSVLVTLMLAALLTLLAVDVATLQPNRIVAGEGYSLRAIMGLDGLLLSLLPFMFATWLAWFANARRYVVIVVILLVYWVSWPWGMSLFAQAMIEPGQQAARVGIGPGLWVLLFLLLLMVLEVQTRLGMPHLGRWLLWSAILVSVAVPFWSGVLNDLALVREYQGNADDFAAALQYHTLLVGAVVVISLTLAVAMALAMRSHDGLKRSVFAILSVIQTIPSLALFGLLLAPLAWLSSQFPLLADLGVQGIGWAPAALALIGYSLLPMTRNTYVALDSIDPNVTEAARGMGMSRWQVFFHVRLPLALPVIVEGIRITSVQAIGLAAVAALIGAGGLGTFVFQGLGQAAMDLVLLGAVPIIVMAVLVDMALSGLAAVCRRGVANAEP